MTSVIGVGLRIAGAAALILICTFLPFLPGSYDGLSNTLSMMARALGYVGQLLVPVGGLWLWRRSRGFGIAAIVVAGAISAIMVMFALMSSGIAFAGIVAAMLGFGLMRAWRSMSPMIGLGFFVTPIVVLALQLLLVPRAVEFSRHRAIANAATMIADIEAARRQHGEYPPSALGGIPDYKPGVIGIEKYHYERAGRAYNLVFKNPAMAFGTDEYVVYNPLDEQYFTAHTYSAIQLSAADLVLERTRGHYAAHPAPFPHWKYFWFD